MPTEQITYREITASDFPSALDLRAAMVRELSGSDPDTTHSGWRQLYVEFYGDRMSRGETALFFAEDQGKPIGMAAVYLSSTHRTEIFKQGSAYVSNVYVKPQWRKRGVAKHLTNLTVEWAKAKGCETIRLRTSTMGRPVYESLGFAPSDELEKRLT